MSTLANPQAWVALITLAALEIVLGIDNIVFISILAGKLPPEQQGKARTLGLAVAMGSRLLLLCSLAWIIRLTTPLFTVRGHGFSGRDLILLLGGLFLLAKATHEIHERLEGAEDRTEAQIVPSLGAVIVQIGLLDVIFSLDSVITAVGMARDLWVMIAAVIIAIGIMMAASAPVCEFVGRHPTVKMLALSFLLLIGMSLVTEAFAIHIPKGYIYFAMGFSVFVEMLNLRLRAPAAEPVRLRSPISKSSSQ